MTKKLDSTIHQIELRIKELIALSKGFDVNVFSIGATDINPRHLAFWIATKTDKERDIILNNQKIREHLNTILYETGYPQEAINHVGLTAESQETVDRDYKGNWWFAIK